MNQAQAEKVRNGKGFIAALDQSGGSTPKALQEYGISAGAWANDDEMFALMHAMRSREKANELLAQNTGLIASFSRALGEGLSALQSDSHFNAVLGKTVDAIYRASIAG